MSHNQPSQKLCLLFFFFPAQACSTLCDPLDGSSPGPSIHGIFQARILGGLPFPSLGDPPDPGMEPAPPMSPELQVDSWLTEPLGKPVLTLRPQKTTDHIIQLNITPNRLPYRGTCRKRGPLKEFVAIQSKARQEQSWAGGHSPYVEAQAYSGGGGGDGSILTNIQMSNIALVSQLCPTLCDPRSPPGSISQARILEWLTMSFSRASSWLRDQTHNFCVFWTAGRFFTCQATGEANKHPDV